MPAPTPPLPPSPIPSFQQEKKLYVIGHRNPDTDSVVAATAYAALKRALGWSRCVAARAGNVNPQTDYVYGRFNVPLPELVPDLIPKVAHFVNDESSVIQGDAPLRDGMERIEPCSPTASRWPRM